MASCDRKRGGTRHFAALLFAFGLCAVSALPIPAHAETAPFKHTARRNSFAAFTAEASQRFHIPAAWICAVMRKESGNNPRAISPKGAIGLMQIMPDTWAEMRARYRLGKDPLDPRDNILAGTAYLRELYDRYGSPGFLAAYNAGPQRYEDYLSKKRRLPAETRSYFTALLPFVGGEEKFESTIVTTATQQRLDQFSVFVALESPRSSASAMQSEASVDAAITRTVRDLSGIVPFSDGLFVASIKHRGQ